MAEIEQYKEDINIGMLGLEELINRSPLFNSDNQKWKTQIAKQTAEIRKNIMLMEEEIKDLPDSQAHSFVGSVKSYKLKLQKLENDTEKRGRGDSFSGTIKKNGIIKTAE